MEPQNRTPVTYLGFDKKQLSSRETSLVVLIVGANSRV